MVFFVFISSVNPPCFFITQRASTFRHVGMLGLEFV